MGWISNIFAPKADAGGKLSTLANPEPWLVEAFLGRPTASGKAVTVESAIRASAVLACRRIISEDIASLPLHLYERTDGGSKVAYEHPLYTLLHDCPNEETTSMEFIESCILNLMDTGHFFNNVIREGGEVTSITPLVAQNAALKRDVNKVLYIEYKDEGDGKVYNLPKEQVWRGSILSTNGINGRSIIDLSREAIGLALAAEEQGARLFSNGWQVNGTLTTPTPFKSVKEREAAMEALVKQLAGSKNAWNTLLLENGMKFDKVGLTAEESQFVESRKFQLAEVARVFRVPGVLLGIEGSSTYASAEQFFQSYVKHTLMPYIKRIEQSITRDLLLPSERGRYYAKFNLAGLMRGDTLSRYQAYGAAIKDGWLSRNEVRETEDYNHVDGLDEYLVPLNMGTQNSDGSVVNNTMAASSGLLKRMEAMAKSGAERIVRKEAKSGTDVNFVVEVLQVIPFEAEAYCAKREQMSDTEAVEYLTNLAMGGK